MSLQKPKDMKDDIITKLVLQKSQITKLLKDVTDYAESRIKEGQKIQGLKLVQGKGGHRAWSDETKAKEFLLAHCPREEVIKEELISPTQADVLQHDLPKEEWAQLQALVFKPEGGPQLAAEDDSRPEYGANKAAQWLEDETEDWI